MSVEADSTKNMTREAKRDYPEIVTPSASLAPSLSTAPLWQQLLLSQAVAQNSAAVLGALPGNDSLRHAHKLHADGAQSSGAETQLTGLRLQPSAFQSYSQQSAAQALLQLPYQGLNSSAPAHASHAHANHAQLATARTASATLLSHAPSTDANSCGAGDDSGLCNDPNACKRKRNLKQQELNKLAQQRYRYSCALCCLLVKYSHARDISLSQMIVGMTALYFSGLVVSMITLKLCIAKHVQCYG